jgi:branched-subunit amino acid aminotransferase/4-amino-4-deoxychorismate lyase
MAWVVLNGVLAPEATVGIAFSDAGLVEGAAVTDFCRYDKGRFEFWAEHTARFVADCNTLGVTLPEDAPTQARLATELMARNHPDGGPAALIRFATPGRLARYESTPGKTPSRPTFAMHTIPLPAERYAHLQAGAHLVRVGLWPTDPLVPRELKHRSRLFWRFAQSRVPAGAIAVVWDEAGQPDTALAGLLMVRGDGVVRPPRGRVLESVSFQIVQQLCQSLGIPFREAPFDFRKSQADQATQGNQSDVAWFLAGSGCGLVRVLTVDGQPQATHATVERLIAAYAALSPLGD